MTSGLQPGDFILLAGAPSTGKTGFCVTIALNLAEDRKSIGFFSLETPKERLTMRLLALKAQIEFSKLRSGVLSEKEWDRIGDAAARVATARIFIDDSAILTVRELRDRAMGLKRERGLHLLIVDYLQLLRGTADSERRDQQISEISRSLKLLARELKMPVIAVSQLYVPVARQDKRPRLSDLKAFRGLEQDADLILLLHRDELYNKNSQLKGTAELIVAKHRNGPVGEIVLGFDDKYVGFRNYYGE
jgi:replicative DNA helicase